MKMRYISQLNDFIGALNECEGQVWIETPEGDRYNLKSTFSQYIAFGRLLSERGGLLELYCSDPSEERFFRPFLSEPRDAK